MAQGSQAEALDSDMSSQCAHRRVMAPDPHNDCVRRLRSNAQLGYGRGYLSYGRDQAGYGQGGANQQSDQPDEEQPKVRREQPTSTSPKVATSPAPKAKKVNPPPRLDAQKERQLYQQFLEWRNRRLFFEGTL